MRRRWIPIAILAALGAACSKLPPVPRPAVAEVKLLGNDLMEPVRLEAAGKPIDTEVGHAAPFVGDYFGTGKNDLLVGQFGEGSLTIYRNEGTKTQPRYAAGVKFKEGVKGGRVPSG